MSNTSKIMQKKIPTLNAGKSETYLRIKIEVLLVRGDHYLFKIHCHLTILCYFKKNLRLLKEKRSMIMIMFRVHLLLEFCTFLFVVDIRRKFGWVKTIIRKNRSKSKVGRKIKLCIPSLVWKSPTYTIYISAL